MSVIAWLPMLSLVVVMVWRGRATDQESADDGSQILGRNPGGRSGVRAWRWRRRAGFAPMDILSLGVVANAMALIRVGRPASRVSPGLAACDCRSDGMVDMCNRWVGTNRRHGAARLLQTGVDDDLRAGAAIAFNRR